jgi:hypothetical protein
MLKGFSVSLLGNKVWSSLGKLRENLRIIEVKDSYVIAGCLVSLIGLVILLLFIISDSSPNQLTYLQKRHYLLTSQKWDQLEVIIDTMGEIMANQQVEIEALNLKIRELEKAILTGFIMEVTRDIIIERGGLYGDYEFWLNARDGEPVDDKFGVGGVPRNTE